MRDPHIIHLVDRLRYLLHKPLIADVKINLRELLEQVRLPIKETIHNPRDAARIHRCRRSQLAHKAGREARRVLCEAHRSEECPVVGARARRRRDKVLAVDHRRALEVSHGRGKPPHNAVDEVGRSKGAVRTSDVLGDAPRDGLRAVPQ